MADEGEPVKPPPEPKLFKVLCCPANTKLGATLVNSLNLPYADNDEDRNTIVGTLAKRDTEVDLPRCVRKVIDMADSAAFTRSIKECDVIVVDLFEVDLHQVEYAIKCLTYETLAKPKILIMLSSVRVWAKTPPKVKRGEEEANEDDVEEEGEDEEEPEAEQDPEPEPEPVLDENGVEKEKPEYLPYRERDYILRRTYSKYQKIKAVETLGLAAGKSRPNLYTYVVCTGVPYGLGEEVLFPIFKQAWLQEPPHIDFYGKGKNKVPTIHFKDIAMHVKFIVYKLPKTHYIFAIDHTKNRAQKRVMKAIAKGIGVPNLRQVEITEETWEIPNFDLFVLDLWMKPSNIFKAKAEGEEEAPEDEPEEEEGADPSKPKKKKLKLKFDWWCQSGIPKNIGKLCKEFNETRGLKPNRILMSGPPISGISHFSKKLAECYNIPLIRIKDVVEAVKKLEDDLGTEVKANLDEQRRALMEVAEKDLEKKRSQGVKGLPEELKEEDFQPRLTEEILVKCYKWRLEQNDCQNRGYILDNYPKTFESCQALFTQKQKKPDEAEPEENAPLELNTKLCPDSIILLNASQNYTRDLLSTFTESQVKGTHYNYADYDRRYRVWKQANFANDDRDVLKDFFKYWSLSYIEVNLDDSKIDHFKSMRIFIDRNGRFINYQTAEANQEQLRLEKEKQDQLRKLREKEEEERKRAEDDIERLQVQQEEVRLKMVKLRQDDQSHLDQKSLYLRTYFRENMQHILKDAILDLSKTMPEDPISHLADYFFKNAYRVPEAAKGDI